MQNQDNDQNKVIELGNLYEGKKNAQKRVKDIFFYLFLIFLFVFVFIFSIFCFSLFFIPYDTNIPFYLRQFVIILFYCICFYFVFGICAIYIIRQKLERDCRKLGIKIQDLEKSIEKEKREKVEMESERKLLELIKEGDRNLVSQDYSVAHQRFEKALEIANKLKSKEKQREIQDKIKQVENEKNIYTINQIKIIKKEADNLKDKTKFKKAILEYQKALGKLNEMFTSNEKNRELEKIEVKINEIYEMQINELLEHSNQLRAEKSFDKSIGVFNNALDVNNKMHMAPEKDEIKNKIETNFDLTYSDIINEKIETGNEIRKDLKFDNSIRIFKEVINIANKMYNSNKKNNEISKIKSLIHQVQIAKIKNTILNLGVKFDRLHVAEIAEKCGESESDIVNTALDMIKKKEIYAEYFKSTKSVVFDKQANIDEIDKLMKAYKDWEEDGISKK